MISLTRIVLLSMLTLLAACFTAQASAQAPDEPAILVETQSLGELLKQAKSAGQILALGGPEGAVAEFESNWKNILGENLEELKCLDLQRALGGYGFLSDKTMAVVLVPVADEKGFLELLGKLGIEAKPGQDGKYDVTLPAGLPPAQLRFADKYAHLAIGPTVAATGPNPIPAAKVFSAGGAKASVTVVVRPGRIAEVIRSLFVSGMQSAQDNDKARRPGETEASYRGRMFGAAMATDSLNSLVSETESITLTYDLNKNGKMIADVRITPRAGTKQAEFIAACGEAKSQPLAIPLAGRTTMRMSASGHKLNELRQLFLDAVEEADPAAKAFIGVFKKHWEAVPTDLTVHMHSTADGPTFAFITTVQGGEELERSLRNFVKTLTPGEQAGFTFNVGKAGDMAIHSVKAPAKAKAPSHFETMYFAIGKNTVVFVGGKGSLEALQKINTAGTPVRAVFTTELSIVATMQNADTSRMASRAKVQPKLDALAKRVFTTPGSDKMTLTMTGGTALLLHTEYDLAGLAYMMGRGLLETQAIFEAVSEELNTPEKKKE